MPEIMKTEVVDFRKLKDGFEATFDAHAVRPSTLASAETIVLRRSWPDTSEALPLVERSSAHTESSTFELRADSDETFGIPKVVPHQAEDFTHPHTSGERKQNDHAQPVKRSVDLSRTSSIDLSHRA